MPLHSYAESVTTAGRFPAVTVFLLERKQIQFDFRRSSTRSATVFMGMTDILSWREYSCAPG